MKINFHRLEVFLEFLIFGIIMGVIEDIIAISVSTSEPITWRVVSIITLISIPFAAIGELLVDKVDFVKIFEKWSKSQKV